MPVGESVQRQVRDEPRRTTVRRVMRVMWIAEDPSLVCDQNMIGV